MAIPAQYQGFATKSTHFNFQGDPCYDKDKLLYDRLLAEQFNHFGVSMVFYKTSFSVNNEPIFGEDNNRDIERTFEVNAYYELPKEDELWTVHGIEGIDNFHMWVSKQHFAGMSTTAVGGGFTAGFSSGFDVIGNSTLKFEIFPEYIPTAGDIIRAKYNDYFYEIVDVGEEDGMFLQQKHSWDFIVKPMKDEKMNVSGLIVSAGDPILDIQNQTDVLSVSGAVDQKKDDILYDPASTETAPRTPFGGW